MKKEMQRHSKLSVFLTPKATPESTMPVNADGTTPLWAHSSPDNNASWRETFMEMADECIEFQKQREPELADPPEPPRMPPPTKIRKALSAPKDAWKSKAHEDVILLLEDDTSYRLPVRQVGVTWVSMQIPQKVWDLWHACNAKMRQLGFTAFKEHDRWQLRYHERQS